MRLSNNRCGYPIAKMIELTNLEKRVEFIEQAIQNQKFYLDTIMVLIQDKRACRTDINNFVDIVRNGLLAVHKILIDAQKQPADAIEHIGKADYRLQRIMERIEEIRIERKRGPEYEALKAKSTKGVKP